MLFFDLHFSLFILAVNGANTSLWRMMISMISFTGVSKEYGGREVLSDLNFQINPGEFICVTGPSGAGKSTIVHLLIRADVPTKGMIEVDGANLAMLPPSILQLYRRRTGVVFQDYKLLPDRTVEENIAFALEVCGEPDEVVDERTAEIMDRLKLSDRADAFPSQLSGGEKTRTALARALVHKPSILIADEPTGNIDPDQSIHILNFLRQVNAEGTTVILATHDKMVVDALRVRVLRLENGKLVRDSVGGYVETASTNVSEKLEEVPVESAPAQQSRIHLNRGTHIPKPRGGSQSRSVPPSFPEMPDEPRAGNSGTIKPIAI